MKYLEKENDFEEIIKSGVVVVDFYADWCGPCQLLSPIIEKVSKKHTDKIFLKVNVDNFPSIARKYGIMSIPTLKIFRDGKIEKTNTGYLNENELEDFIK